MNRDISNSEDVLDSRDIIARIEALQDERDSYQPDTEDGIPEDEDVIEVSDEARAKAWAEANEDDASELRVLLALQDEAEGSPDWPHGETLIRDSYFERYAQELAEDCAPFSRNSPEGKVLDSWPYRCIDWEQATRELQQDYMMVDFDGVDYWIRA